MIKENIGAHGPNLEVDSYKSTTTFIMAGGLGTRLRPITYFIPKSLLPWNGKRIIDYTIEPCIPFSDNIIAAANIDTARRVFPYIRSRWPEVKCLEEPKLLKAGGVIKFHMDLISDIGTDNFLLLVPDHIRRVNLKDVVTHHFTTENEITIMVSNPSETNNQVIVENELVTHYLPHNRPLFENSFSSTGEYVFKWSSLSKFLETQREEVFDIGWGVFYKMLQLGNFKIGAYHVGDWLDLGTWKRYLSLSNRRRFK